MLKNNVRVLRTIQAITQRELAEKVGVTRQTISLIEKGQYNPTINLCLRICYVLNKKLDDIFWVDERENQK
ncbi:helix-turn-helix transcriptional regulator [Lentilactobacillus otakiensis]|uniref:helix-turn-helix transcriptional regulator n=1 Tax=Lentilactobacillus otakiensis TaxID=481720 RepID=UPI003D1745C6